MASFGSGASTALGGRSLDLENASGSCMAEMMALFTPPGRDSRRGAGAAGALLNPRPVELHPYFKRPGEKRSTILFLVQHANICLCRQRSQSRLLRRLRRRRGSHLLRPLPRLFPLLLPCAPAGGRRHTNSEFILSFVRDYSKPSR